MDARAPTPDIEGLRHAAQFVQLRRSLKTAGKVSIGFGVLNLLLGLAGLAETPIAAAVALLGLGLVVVGVWNLRSPTPHGMLADAISMFVLSAWNMFVGLATIAAGVPADAFPALFFGVAQFAWAIAAERRYRRYAALAAEHPSPESLQRLDTLVEDLSGDAAAARPDVIDFEAGPATGRRRWRGQLSQPWGVFFDTQGGDILVARPDEVQVTDRGEVLLGMKHKATVAMAGRKMPAILTPTALERLAAWKVQPAA